MGSASILVASVGRRRIGGVGRPLLLVHAERMRTTVAVTRAVVSSTIIRNNPCFFYTSKPLQPTWSSSMSLSSSFPLFPSRRLLASTTTTTLGQAISDVDTAPAKNGFKKIRIFYATSYGTAQLFATQLSEALKESLGLDDVADNNDNDADKMSIKVSSLGEYKTWQDLLRQQSSQDSSNNVLNLFIVSTAGVGDPPAPAKEFYDNLMATQKEAVLSSPSFRYAVFGLGNQAAHPNHYNVMGKTLQKKLEELVGPSALPLHLGDDSDCIEDDFDRWQEQVVALLQNQLKEQQQQQQHETIAQEETPTPPTSDTQQQQEQQLHPPLPHQQQFRFCPVTKHGTRLVSLKYPFLKLLPPDRSRFGKRDLLDVAPDFYDKAAQRYTVASRIGLNPSGVTNGLVELGIQLPPNDDLAKTTSYQAGDHFLVYPRNPDCLVEAFCNYIGDVNPYAIIAKDQPAHVDESPHHYRLPKGISVYETLSFCVDLSAVPCPQFTRLIMGGDKTVNYKEHVAGRRRTALGMIMEYAPPDQLDKKLALEDLLYNLPPMHPRYYSIASSPLLAHNERQHGRGHVCKNVSAAAAATTTAASTTTNDVLLLAYRPIRYVTQQGHLRQGTCTSYMNHLTEGSIVVGSIHSNPSFRLPQDPQTPVVFIAGGCGVAPIRAFLEERLAIIRDKPKDYYGKATLFLGFRDTDDVPYQPLIEACLDAGALTQAFISTEASLEGKLRESHPAIRWSSGKITSLFDERGSELWHNHFQRGGYTFLCGGARTFGVAVEKEVLSLIQRYANMTDDEASAYLRQMIAEGRFLEDLAD